MRRVGPKIRIIISYQLSCPLHEKYKVFDFEEENLFYTNLAYCRILFLRILQDRRL